MKIRKVCVVITARPSYSRIRSVLFEIKKHPALELQLVVAASALLDRYGTTVNLIEKDGFEITEKVYMIIEGENLATMAKSTGMGLVELATVFDNLKPDIVVTIADRFETIATAISAAYMNIPLAHVQGGEITGSIDDKVRHAITKLADIHLASNSMAAERLKKMGESDDSVFVTGCPSIDIAAEIKKNPLIDFNPFEKYGGVGESVNISNGYLVVMQHPVTTEYSFARKHIEETLYAIKELDIPTLWFWPNVDAGSDGTSKGIRSFRELYSPANIHFFKNLRSADFLRLLYNCKCIIGNSSVAIRECSFLGVPAINIGTRQEGRQRGKNVIDVDYDRNQITDAINKQILNGRYPGEIIYGNGNSGYNITQVLAEVPLNYVKHLYY